MSATSFVMMVIAMVIIWGGLGLAVFNLMHSTPPSPDEIKRDL